MGKNDLEYMKRYWVKRPVYGFALDLIKGHVHVFDGEDFYIIEKARKGGITIGKE